ncbi:MAG TPA: response regulator [Gammaproteobacteria bacterium]|nr:response regulator [Gammaproteobacteria bacterium]
MDSPENETWLADDTVTTLTGDEWATAPLASSPEPVSAVATVVPLPPDADPTVAADVLALVAGELAAVQDSMVEAIAKAAADEAGRSEALETYAAEISLFAGVVESVGMPSLKSVLDKLLESIPALQTGGLSAEQAEGLTLVPGLLLIYLQSPNDASVCHGITDLLQKPIWSAPLTAPEAAALAQRLVSVRVSKEATQVPARQVTATADDVSLDFPPDLNPELLAGLLLELPRQTADFSAAVQRLTTGAGSMSDVDSAKRSAHTLKGAAHTVGIRGIGNLTHHVEDILIALSDNQQLPGPAVAAVLTSVSDCLEGMSETVMGIGVPPEQSLAVLQDVLDWANRFDREGPAAQLAHDIGGDQPVPAAQTAPEPAAAVVPANAVPSPSEQHPTEENQAPMIWVSSLLMDELLRLVGETIISTSQIRERVRKVARQSDAIGSQNKAFLHLASELEHVVDIHGLPVASGARSQTKDFDPLEFEHYSEMHTLSRRLIEAAHDSRELSVEVEEDLGILKELIEMQNRLHMESQKAVLQTRMVQVKTVVPRLQRSLRQACRLLEKQVALDVSGTDTPIDANILNDLMDPLMHLLRNAVDHGIEAAPVRAALGKQPGGQIALSFSREANHVVVRCQDDGAGLDLARIRALAIERQLISADQAMSDDEVMRLILLPGFSTRREATQISGRGIGMDIVNSRILELKGSLALHSTPGKGLLVELRVPAALISTHALLVRQGDRVMALSTHGIEDIHYAAYNQIQQLGDERIYQSSAGLHPLMDLETLLHVQERRGKSRSASGTTLLLVRLATGGVQAIAVQEILDSRDLVIKKLNRYMPRIMGVVGAAILGDGNVSPVIDLPELLRATAVSGDHRAVGVTTLSGETTGTGSNLTALVVDDSLSARRTTAQLMKDAGFEVRTAIDGMEAVSILEKWTPSVLLVDMEMPRMNGLELTSHIRSHAAKTRLPIIMITSRSTEKHRQQAQAAGVDAYFTKPFREHELLDQVTRFTALHHE